MEDYFECWVRNIQYFQKQKVGGIKAILHPLPPEWVQHFGCICDMNLEFFLEKQKLVWPGEKIFFFVKNQKWQKKLQLKILKSPKTPKFGYFGLLYFYCRVWSLFDDNFFGFFHCRVWSLFDHKFSDFFTAEFSHLKLVIKTWINGTVKF